MHILVINGTQFCVEMLIFKEHFNLAHTDHRSEGFPERDIWFLGTLDQGSARCPELLGRRRRRHLEIQVDIQARKLLLKVFLRFWGRGERYLRMETGVLLRISLRTS